MLSRGCGDLLRQRNRWWNPTAFVAVKTKDAVENAWWAAYRQSCFKLVKRSWFRFIPWLPKSIRILWEQNHCQILDDVTSISSTSANLSLYWVRKTACVRSKNPYMRHKIGELWKFPWITDFMFLSIVLWRGGENYSNLLLKWGNGLISVWISTSKERFTFSQLKSLEELWGDLTSRLI